jgi:fatty-acyl-CoA synthase
MSSAGHMSYWSASDEVPILRRTVGDLLRRTTADARDCMAVVDGTPGSSRSWTYGEFLDIALRCAGRLVEQFGSGARIGLWAANSPEWLILQQAAALAGAQLVTINPAYRYAELRYVLRDSGCVALFHGGEHRGADLCSIAERAVDELAELTASVGLREWIADSSTHSPSVDLPHVGESEVAVVQYTSGTTGSPKGVLISHFSMVNSAHFVACRAGIGRGCVYVNPMPTFHIGSCGTVTLGTISSAGTQVILPSFEPGRVLELIEKHRATALLAVPTMLIGMLEHTGCGERDLSSLEIVLTGGSTASADLVHRTRAAFDCKFSITFGQTETGGPSTQTDPDGALWEQSESIGRALPHTEMKIVDPITGETLPVGEQGEICSRGPTTMLGYLHRPDDQSQRPDGWLHYGDLGTMDEDGYIRVTGRLKDMIIRGGENISPREIEEVLCAHPAVLDAVVVGARDEKWGEQVAAFVRVAEPGGIGEEQLAEHCWARLAQHKIPRIWRFVKEFPLTPSGKVQKFKLREELV